MRALRGRENTDDRDQEHDREDAEDVPEDGDGVVALSRAAPGVLWFSRERNPAVMAQFVRLRVIDPEEAYWQRGIEATTWWLREIGNPALRVPYTVVTPQDAGRADRPSARQRISEQRRAYAAGTLEAGRWTSRSSSGMVWS
ncbi:hypothetical protein ACIOZL_40500 [Streptomyces sp. NPDC087769]|uniref:hypothetical protein n=1 Tax=Streptomyces sp. NPDC087769 TaxID=3365802 RepID=UPI00380010A7